MWQAFVDFSQTINNNEAQCEATCKAASQTFEVFIQTLDDYMHRELQYSHQHTS